MKVFVVLGDWGAEGSRVIGVYSTEKAAMEAHPGDYVLVNETCWFSLQKCIEAFEVRQGPVDPYDEVVEGG